MRHKIYITFATGGRLTEKELAIQRLNRARKKDNPEWVDSTYTELVERKP